MAEKRKLKKKIQEAPVEEEIKATKVEYAIAKFMKNNVPIKKTRFLSHQVSYFTANKAIDALLDSPWATGENAIFTDRESVVHFCSKLLEHKFFHRAKKIAITDSDLSTKELKKRQEKRKRGKEKKKEESDESKNDGKSLTQVCKEEPEKQKKKRSKIKLDMHLEQVFVDGSDAYVWMYDPIPYWYYIVGGLLLFSAVAICLFPLWPPIVRQGVYYLSLAAAGFLGLILGLAVLRFIVFMIIWTLSLGRHHFWILPNLTEDVGFLASFWPLYDYEYRGETYDKKKKSKKKQSSSDNDKDGAASGLKSYADDGMDSQSACDTDKPETDGERLLGSKGSGTDETDESVQSNSQTFELVDKDELPMEENVTE